MISSVPKIMKINLGSLGFTTFHTVLSFFVIPDNPFCDGIQLQLRAICDCLLVL